MKQETVFRCKYCEGAMHNLHTLGVTPVHYWCKNCQAHYFKKTWTTGPQWEFEMETWAIDSKVKAMRCCGYGPGAILEYLNRMRAQWQNNERIINFINGLVKQGGE